jgi:hypothetical protein
LRLHAAKEAHRIDILRFDLQRDTVRFVLFFFRGGRRRQVPGLQRLRVDLDVVALFVLVFRPEQDADDV